MDISKIKVSNTTYQVKDSVARASLDNIFPLFCSWENVYSYISNNELTAGRYYAFDYMATTTLRDSISTGIAGVVIVLAIAKNKLNEDALLLYTTPGQNPFFGGVFRLRENTTVFKIKYSIENILWSAARKTSGRWFLAQSVLGPNAPTSGTDHRMLIPLADGSVSIGTKTYSIYYNPYLIDPTDSKEGAYVAYLSLTNAWFYYNYNNGTIGDLISAISFSLADISYGLDCGTGTVLEMLDDNGNKCGFDFMGIQFNRCLRNDSNEDYYDMSSGINDYVFTYPVNETYFKPKHCRGVVIENYFDDDKLVWRLPNITLCDTGEGEYKDIKFCNLCNTISLNGACKNVTFKNSNNISCTVDGIEDATFDLCENIEILSNCSQSNFFFVRDSLFKGGITGTSMWCCNDILIHTQALNLELRSCTNIYIYRCKNVAMYNCSRIYVYGTLGLSTIGNGCSDILFGHATDDNTGKFRFITIGDNNHEIEFVDQNKEEYVLLIHISPHITFGRQSTLYVEENANAYPLHLMGPTETV